MCLFICSAVLRDLVLLQSAIPHFHVWWATVFEVSSAAEASCSHWVIALPDEHQGNTWFIWRSYCYMWKAFAYKLRFVHAVQLRTIHATCESLACFLTFDCGTNLSRARCSSDDHSCYMWQTCQSRALHLTRNLQSVCHLMNSPCYKDANAHTMPA